MASLMSLSVYLSLCLLVVYGQSIKRPEVPARAVDDNEMNVIIANCRARIDQNSSVTHYVSVPSDCSAYAVCEHPGLGVIPALMNCPSGLFFDDSLEPNILTCNRPGLVTCTSAVDPCTGMLDGYNEDRIRSQPTQAAYYFCRNGQTMMGDWCELGEQFGNPDVPCAPIPGFAPPQTTVTPTPPCPFEALPNDQNRYMSAGISMPCAPGTVFKPEKCLCDHPF